MSGSEEFQDQAGGKKQDADLHKPILEDGDTVGAFAATYVWLLGQGWSEARIEETYPLAYAQLKRSGLPS